MLIRRKMTCGKNITKRVMWQKWHVAKSQNLKFDVVVLKHDFFLWIVIYCFSFYIFWSFYYSFHYFRSRSNNDLLNIDNNSDTASLHSLPVNSNIPGLEKSLSTENNHMDDMFTASSPVTSPTRDDCKSIESKWRQTSGTKCDYFERC